MGERESVRRSSDTIGGNGAEPGARRNCYRDSNDRGSPTGRQCSSVTGPDAVALLPVALVVHPLVVALVPGHRGGLRCGCGRAGVRQVEPGAKYPGTQQDCQRGQDGPKRGRQLHAGGSLSLAMHLWQDGSSGPQDSGWAGDSSLLKTEVGLDIPQLGAEASRGAAGRKLVTIFAQLSGGTICRISRSQFRLPDTVPRIQ